MILNYDSKEGFKLLGFVDSIKKALKTQQPAISDEVKKFFNSIGPDENLGDILFSMDYDSIKDPSFNAWLNELSESMSSTEMNVLSASKAFDMYKASIVASGKTMSGFTKILQGAKGLLANLASGFVNAAAIWAVTKVIEVAINAVDNYINRVQITIDKGKEAQEAISDITKAFDSKKEFMNNSKDRIIELSLGVDTKTNENISLTNEEYQEYLSLCDQLVNLFPEVSSGVDSQGRSMVNLGDSANSATEKLAELLDQERQLTDYKISQNLQTAFEGVIAQTQVLQNSLVDTTQKISDLENMKNAMTNVDDMDMKSLGFDYNNDGNEYVIKLSYAIGNEEEVENYTARYNSFINAIKESGLDTSENMFEDFNDNLTNDNGEPIVEWTGHIINATKDQLDEFINHYRGTIKEAGVEVSEQLMDAYMLKSQDEKEIKANWNSLLPSLLTAVSVYDGYDDLSDNVKQAISDGISSIDPVAEWMNEDGTWNAPENIRAYLREKFLDPFIDAASGSSPELAKAFDSLFNLDTSLPVSEYQDKINQILQVIQKSFNDLYGADGAEKFSDFLITFGFKIVDENGNELDSTESMISEIKQRAFQKGENLGNGELLQTLTYDQLVKVHTTVIDSEYGGTIADAIKKETEKQIEQINSEPISFSSLFTNEAGEQSEFSKNIDTFQSDISSIQESLDTLKQGENVNFNDLVQQFPQLSGEADNLSEALNNLKVNKLKDFGSTWKEAVSDLDSEELAKANQYLSELLSTLSLSDTDINYGDIATNLLKNVTSNNEGVVLNTLSMVYKEFGDTVEGREVIAKLSLNTDAANWTYEEWVEQIESEEIKADLRLSEESIADLQKQLEMKQSEASVIQSEIDLKNTAGYRTTEKDYQKLIENGKEQIAIQDDIIKKKTKERDNVKKVAQSTEQAAAKYNELQKEIDSATATLNDAYKSQIEWNTALDNLPITNAQSLSSAISSAMSEIDTSTGLTVDTVAALKEQFSELANIDVEDALYRTADGLKIDTNELERFTEAQNDAVMSQFESKIEAQRKAIELYKATIGDNATDSKLIQMQDDLESLLNRQAQYFAEYKNQMEQFTDYEDVQRAKNTENAGSHYDTMLSDLKTAKESYDKGLIGTDDFKSVAKYISPNGFDDFTNFAGNYSKATRYLTEDSSGVINFLNDLQAKGYAAYQTLDDGSNQWIINIQDFADAAKDIGIGTDFFTDMFGKLEDYNIPNTFVSSVTEGELKIDDLTKQLVDAKVKLAELKAEGADTAVIDSQQKVVDELYTSLTNTQQSMNMFVESTKQNYAEGFTQVRDVISELNNFRKNAQSEEEAQGYLSKIQEYADKYHLKLTADFEVDEALYQEQMDKMYTKTGSFENPVDPGFEKGSADAENYKSVLESVTKAHAENNKVLDESIKTLSKYDTETLKGVNLSDGQYSSGLEDAERALDSLAQELGLTEEQAQMLAVVLGSLGQTRGEVNVDYVDVTEAISNLEKMQELGQIDETIDLKADLSELDSNELVSYLERLKNVQVKLNPDTDEYDYVTQRIQDTEIQMTIKEILENGSTVEELLNMSDEDLAKTCNIDLNDDGASERLASIKENLQELDNGADITVRMDDAQFNQLLSDQNNDTATITVDANNEPAKEKIDEAKDYADDQTGTMGIDGDKQPAIDEANRAVSEINAKTATISIDGDLRLLSQKLTEELSKTRTINVSARVSGMPKEGEALGTAHARGTAVLDMWNGYRHSIGAYANGTAQNWALPHNEEALVNETGEPESIVRDGRWFLIPGGAHVEQLRKNDIIFNAAQTRELIKYGRVISGGGAGKVAYANGTAYNMMPSYKAGTSTGANTMLTPNGVKTSSTTDKASKSYQDSLKKNTSETDKNTKAKQKSTQAIDWVKTKLDIAAKNVQRFADTITDFVSYTYANLQLGKQIKAVQKEITANQKGEKTYMAKANSIAKKYTYTADKGKTQSVSIPKEYINKVKKGAWKIEDMDTSTTKGKALAEAIQKYQEYYDKAQDCADATRELTQTEKELRVQRLENIAANYDAKASLKASRISNIQSSMEVDKALGKTYGTTYASNKNVENANAQKQSQQIKDELASAQAYGQNLRGEKEALTKQLKNTKNKKKRTQLKNQISVIDSELSKNKSKQSQLKNQLSSISVVDENSVPKSEEQQYKSMINASQDQQKYLEKKKTSVTKEFNSLVAKGTIKKGSAEWYKWKEDIAAIDDEINQCAVDQAEWNDAIANIPLNKKKDEFTALQVDAEKLNDEIALKNTKGIKTSAADYQKLIDNSESQVANLKDQNVLLQEQLSKTDVGTDKYNELLGKINDNNDAIRNAEQSQVEWNNAIANIPLEKIQEALDKLDALGALYESANNLKSKMGQDLTVDDYDTQIQNNIDKIAQEENNIAKYSQYGEFAQMETYAKKAKESGAAYNGKTYTEWMTTYYNALKEQGLNNGKEFNEWLTGIEKEGLDGKFDQKSFDEWNTEIDKTKTNINNLKAANEDLKDSKRDDVYWRDFERAHEAAQRLKDEIDGIAGLISDDMIFNTDGKLTDFGLSKVATNVKDLEIARGEVQNYTNDIANLNKLYAEGQYTEEEYKEKLAELKNGVLDSASAMKTATDAIMDMYKSMGQAELDSLFEVIDARRQSLQSKKEYYDYDKSLKAKNKNIQSLKAEIAALEGIATASSKAELAKKRAELADAQGELDDMIVDHQMELSQTALDGMKESLQDAFDDKWQNMHSDLGAIADLMESANTLVKSSTSDINANLNELLKYYGIDPVATGIDLGKVTKNAKGTKRVGYNGFGITQEAGREIVLKDGSVLLPVKASDGIIPNQLTENLFKMAKDYPFMNASVPQTITPIVNLKTEGMGGNVTYYFDSLINVEGNLDSVTGKEVIDIIKAQMPSISQYTRKDIVKDAGKAGVRF